MRRIKSCFLIWLLIIAVISGCSDAASDNPDSSPAAAVQENDTSGEEASREGAKGSARDGSFDTESPPSFQGDPYVDVNGGEPFFTAEELQTDSFEEYSELDDLGRCGPATACIARDIMPTEKRGAIGHIRPSGWHTAKYDFLSDKYLYNRCHLIGFQLAGENDNEKNLITGTRYLNVDGMLPFEDEVADYVRDNNGRVLYRVTPVFQGDNLVASGVLMEGQSLESDSVRFCVYCFNVQPGIDIDYKDGSSAPEGEKKASAGGSKDEKAGAKYVVNKNTQKFHRPDCGSVKDMKPQNREYFSGSREEALERGYSPCDRCKP